MDSESTDKMPLHLNTAGRVLKLVNGKIDAERTHSDKSSISSNSRLGLNSLELSTSESQMTESSGNKRCGDVPSASSTKEKCTPVAVKKKVKKGKYYCHICEVKLTKGDHRNHHLGKQHTKKAVPRIKTKSCITVSNFNSNVTEGVLYDYFSIVGSVETVVICRGLVSHAVVEFACRCSVDHAVDCLAEHILKGSELFVFKGLPFGKKPLNNHPDISSSSGKVSFTKKSDSEREMKKVACHVCNVLLDKSNSRDHYLSREHTKNAYSRVKAKHCVYVTGFHHDTSAKALYDYFSLPGRVITLVILEEKKICAVVEFSQKCSAEHVVECLVPHKLGNTMLTVVKGLEAFGGKLPKTPDFQFGNKVSVLNSVTEKGITPCAKSTQEKDEQKRGMQKNKKGRVIYACHLCNATFPPGRRRQHYLRKFHTERAVPVMRENSCITVSGFHTETTMEMFYDFFNSFESVRTIDTRRQSQGIVVIEFESNYPLPNFKGVTTMLMRNMTLTVIRGCPSLEIPVQSPISHKKEEQCVIKNKPIDCGVKSQPKSSVSSILDDVIQNEFKKAMKSLQIKEPVVGTVVQNQVANSAKDSGTNSEIKTEVKMRPVMCDPCNVFYNPEFSRDHHISKKHNRKAMQFMIQKCCISVKRFLKDTKLEALYDYFSQFGEVKAVAIHKKKESVAIVEFYDVNSARAALKAKKSHMFQGRTLSVQPGQPKYNGGIPLETLPPHRTLMSSLQKCKTVYSQLSCIQSSLLLSIENRQSRMDLCALLRAILVPYFPHCVLHLFGSSVNSFGLQGSDVDILFEVDSDKPNEVEQENNYSKAEIKSPSIADVIEGRFPVADLACLPRVFQLDFIKKVLRKYPHEFHTVVFVPSATCPIVKFVSQRWGLSCDISNGNRMSLCNTGLLNFYGRLDKRVIPLVTTLRYWAKKFNYIHSRNFSSYAFTLLVIFFLQTRESPVLPSVNFLRSLTDKKMMIDNFDCSFCSDCEKIEPSTNSETSENLLWEFFSYYEKFDFSKFVISPLTGCCEPVEHFTSNGSSNAGNFKISPVCIQDPFLISRNVSSFVKEGTLAVMIDHLHKIARQYYYDGIHKKDTRWDILHLFDVMPTQMNTKVPKKRQDTNSWTMIKIILNEAIMDCIQKKYDISCIQCVNSTEIAIHDICCFITHLMHDVLLFDIQITVDKKNHREWETKGQSVQYLCSCRDPCNNSLSVDDVQDENLGKKLVEMKNISCSTNINDSSVSNVDVQGEEPAENSCVTNDILCSDDSNLEDSSAEDSDKECDSETVHMKVPDEPLVTQALLAEERSSECFDSKDHEPFLCIQLTAIYQTWVCRTKYKNRCNRDKFESTLEFEKCISQKISQDKTLKMERPAVFKCEFYDYHIDTKSKLFLKVIPPELKPCWKPLTSFLEANLKKWLKVHFSC